MYEILQWNKLPDDLAYLGAHAEKYGKYQFDDNIFEFFNGMSVSDKDELVALL